VRVLGELRGPEKRVIELHDGKLLSRDWGDFGSSEYSRKGMLRLWDGETGNCLWTGTDDRCLLELPEIYQAWVGPNLVNRGFVAGVIGSATECIKSVTDPLLICWQGGYPLQTLFLGEDGNVSVALSNGEVCFLNAHLGNRRIKLAELSVLEEQM
jgi:hypothetical protein